ncbi:MAG: NAD(P)-dependent dehydrogenase (short-subunit alcohol dehydrogenase family) [Candidatus Azotimanducaceae bacterium]|jgi:NAD(P)-dependent dehydrogenase (short-subunit alcohol dehydrogenase family)
MVKSMAMEVSPRGIKVKMVSSGDIELEGGAWGEATRHNAKVYAKFLSDNPMRRLDEIADVVAFIASERASLVSDANILADGAATTELKI